MISTSLVGAKTISCSDYRNWPWQWRCLNPITYSMAAASTLPHSFPFYSLYANSLLLVVQNCMSSTRDDWRICCWNQGSRFPVFASANASFPLIPNKDSPVGFPVFDQPAISCRCGAYWNHWFLIAMHLSGLPFIGCQLVDLLIQCSIEMFYHALFLVLDYFISIVMPLLIYSGPRYQWTILSH